ncbi:MAG TPA: ScpA family protein [Candidatus Paceibacterota bacterium]|nr:ScpA family protein [Candidatus Paceibacterota bacterium]
MEPFTIESEHYQGPLETLLDLIESRKLSVSMVSLSEVCDAYLAYVEKLPELPVSETSQFVLVASTLLLIKSRSLLPVPLTDEEEQSIEELERRLKRLAKIREASKTLKKHWGTTPLVFARRTPNAATIIGMEKPAFAPAETTMQTLRAAAQKLIQTLPKPERLAEATVAPILKLEDVIVDLKKRLTGAVKARWSDFTKGASRGDLIVHFLAVLELARHGSVSVTQDRLFSDIIIESEVTDGAPRYG